MLKTIHEIADAVLKAVNKRLDQYAFIAGGYARDKHFGIQPKDIDIVLYVPDSVEKVVNTYRVIDTLDLSGFSVSKPLFFKIYNEDGSLDWADEVVKLKVDGHAIDLLFLKNPVSDPNKVFESFDFGICRIGIRDGKELSSEWFEKDERDQTLTLLDTTRNAEDSDRILTDHLPRLQAKFPAYTPVGLEKIKEDK